MGREARSLRRMSPAVAHMGMRLLFMAANVEREVTLPYAIRLRLHLAGSKRAGVPFQQGWRNALRKVTRETDFPVLCESRRPKQCELNDYSCCAIREAFRDGYLNIGRGAGMSAIAERDRLTVDYVYVTPERTSRRCGWGGSYCREQGAPWLCAEHAAVIDAIPERCGSHMCRRDAEPESPFCVKHAHKAGAMARGGDAKAERAAA